jgi:hypothetical protein
LGHGQRLSEGQKEQKMKKRYLIIAISMTLVQGCYTAPPYQPSSHVSVGINYSTYPDLVQIPGYPVYYAPRVDSNYFFYDGLYWFQGITGMRAAGAGRDSVITMPVYV